MAKVAFVTGGTRGIGRAICQRLKADGFEVAAGYSGNEAAAEACARDLGVMVVKGNVGVFADCKAAVDQVAAELGPVDVLVNCAGIMDIISITGTGWEQGKRLLDINFTAPMRLMDLALPTMVEARNGCVINVASMAGRVPIRGCSYYGGAKAGIGLASEIARLDLKKQGVNVITVYPGPIHSGLESHARSQVKKGPVSRYIPTGKPEVLAERIYRTFRKGGARVIYPDIYALAKQVANLNLTNRAMDFFSPQPNQ